MKDIFTSFDDENSSEDIFSKHISFDNNDPDLNNNYSGNFDSYEDFDTGRSVGNFDDFSSSYEPVRPLSDSFSRNSSDTVYSEPFYGEDMSSFSEPPEVSYNQNGYMSGYSYQSENFSDNNYSQYESQNDYDLPHESTDDEFEKQSAIQTDKIKAVLLKKNNGKKNVKKLILSSIVCLILILAMGVSGLGFYLCSKTDYQPESHKENEFIAASDLYSDNKVTNILIIGTDKRQSQVNYRSDSMILLSLDKKTKKMKLTSFLRDSYVYIPAKGFSTKLNASCSYGGPQMVIDTIEYNFKVHIDKFVMIDFNVFKTMIRELGGVTLTMTEEEAACIERESGHKCKSGTHNYNAKLALWYARIRHLDSDFKRTDRQRKVIAALVDKMKKSSPVTLYNMMNNVLPLLQTDMNSSELFKTGLSSLPFLSYDIEELQIPAKGTWSNAYINGQAVLKLDLEENTRLIKEFIYG